MYSVNARRCAENPVHIIYMDPDVKVRIVLVEEAFYPILDV